MSRLINLMCSYLALSAVFVAALYFFLGVQKMWALADAPIKTTGQIVDTVCDHHHEFHYSFLVEGNEFKGTGLAASLEACTNLGAHSDVPVYYLKNAPAVNTTSDPGKRLLGNIMFMAIVALCFPLPVVLAFLRMQRYYNNN